MKVKTTVSYYKRKRRGKSPATYKARQPRGVGTTVHAKIRLDPTLKSNPDLQRLILKHEKRELRAWGKGKTRPVAHRKAQRATRRDDHFDTPSEYWRLIAKRKKKR